MKSWATRMALGLGRHLQRDVPAAPPSGRPPGSPAEGSLSEGLLPPTVSFPRGFSASLLQTCTVDLCGSWHTCVRWRRWAAQVSAEQQPQCTGQSGWALTGGTHGWALRGGGSWVGAHGWGLMGGHSRAAQSFGQGWANCDANTGVG